jgi:acetoacetyl-CoA reductase
MIDSMANHLGVHCTDAPDSYFNFAGRTVLITGGTGDLGSAMVCAFAKHGARVVVLYGHNTNKANALHAQYPGIIPIACDVMNRDALLATLHTLTAHYPVDILIHSAGIIRDGVLTKMAFDDWRAVISVHLDCLFDLCQSVLPGMKDRQWGRIIALSSVNAFRGQVGQTAYSAAKAGVVGFVRSLAQEVARYGITVNALAPGYCQGTMVDSVPQPIAQRIQQTIPMRRWASAHEIAYHALTLASRHAGYMTGAVLHSNGGMFMG